MTSGVNYSIMSNHNQIDKNAERYPGRDAGRKSNWLMMAFNVLSQRMSSLRSLFGDPRRNIEDECGLPRLDTWVNCSEYKKYFERVWVARRAVELPCKEAWKITPDVYEDEGTSVETPFEKKWKEIGRSLISSKSKFKGEQNKGNPIWEYLRRADIMSGIGRYGVLLIGTNDNKPLSAPVDGVEEAFSMRDGTLLPDPIAGYLHGTSDPYFGVSPYDMAPPPQYNPQTQANGTERRLTFLRVFPEYMARISRYDANILSPRYGQPIEYEITLNSPDNGEVYGVGLNVATYKVHWTRVIHIADDVGVSEVFATPRLQPILNNVLDLHKLLPSSAEMYYKGAFFGLSIESHPQLGADLDMDVESLKGDVEKYYNGLQRALYLEGALAKQLAPTVVDPTPQIERQIEAICICLGCPVRIFKGAERGELASSQDEADWRERMEDRQQSYLTPRLIVPLIDRLIAMRILPEPETYTVCWPSMAAQTPQEKSAVAFQLTQALGQYISSGAFKIMTPLRYLVTVFKLSEEEAQSAIDEVNPELMKELLDPAPEPEITIGPDGKPFAKPAGSKVDKMKQINPAKQLDTKEPLKDKTDNRLK